ncbi:hypothetical protein QSH57_004999 [Fusarium oxysporum f. sp. vasinfectum]|nr:hypothetical protein QSH57_004999 [Fusarium oxysporum f. sp. vasinfectum]
MPLESQPLASRSEYRPGLPQQHGSVAERASTSDCTRPQSRTDHALSETSTINFSNTSNHGSKSEMNHEGITHAYYDDAFTDRGDEDFDDEGCFDLDTASTTSVNTVAENFQQLFGRQYHNEGIGYHWEPNDETRQEMWDGFHDTLWQSGIVAVFIVSWASANRYNKRVLDVGTGTGIWAIDFADEHPDADVIGIDISPIIPNWVPPNLKFQIDDCDREWTFKESSFDYIHARDLNGSVSWREFSKEVFRALAPGGVAEFHEGPIEFRSRKEMAAAGFKDITVYEYEIPIGPWPELEEGKTLGKFALAILTLDIVGSILRLAIEDFGWSEKETHVFAARVRNEILSCSTEYEIYTSRKVVVGKKPE